jgi:hypothetical protein
MNLLEKKKQDNAGEIIVVIMRSWRLFNKNVGQLEARATDQVKKLGLCFVFLEGAADLPPLQETG